MARQPTKDEVARYARGENLPPDLLARVERELQVNAELRATVQLLMAGDDEFDEEDFDDLDDADDSDLAERLSLLGRSRLAVVTWSGAIPNQDGARVTATVNFGKALGSCPIQVTRDAGRLTLSGTWPAHVRPLTLIECPTVDAGISHRQREFFEKSWSMTVPPMPQPQPRGTVEHSPITAGIPIAKAKAAPVLAAAGLDAESAFKRTDLAKPYFDGDELVLPEVPERDATTHRELLVAELKSATSDQVYRFVVPVGRVEEKRYLRGRLEGARNLLPQMGGTFTITLRKPVGDDWLGLEPEAVSVGLKATPHRMWPLKPTADGTLGTPNSYTPGDSEATNWLLRFAV